MAKEQYKLSHHKHAQLGVLLVVTYAASWPSQRAGGATPIQRPVPRNFLVRADRKAACTNRGRILSRRATLPRSKDQCHVTARSRRLVPRDRQAALPRSEDQCHVASRSHGYRAVYTSREYILSRRAALPRSEDQCHAAARSWELLRQSRHVRAVLEGVVGGHLRELAVRGRPLTRDRERASAEDAARVEGRDSDSRLAGGRRQQRSAATAPSSKPRYFQRAGCNPPWLWAEERSVEMRRSPHRRHLMKSASCSISSCASIMLQLTPSEDLEPQKKQEESVSHNSDFKLRAWVQWRPM